MKWCAAGDGEREAVVFPAAGGDGAVKVMKRMEGDGTLRLV